MKPETAGEREALARRLQEAAMDHGGTYLGALLEEALLAISTEAQPVSPSPDLSPPRDLFQRLGLSSEQEWRGFRNGWNAHRMAVLGEPAQAVALAPSNAAAREYRCSAGTYFPVKRWPFVESPGEFAQRFQIAHEQFGGDYVAAVRHVLIENPPFSVAPSNAPYASNAIPGDQGDLTERSFAMTRKLLGALRFILAFYEPGQTCLDTNAWKQAEASGRAAVGNAEAFLAEALRSDKPEKSDSKRGLDHAAGQQPITGYGIGDW